MTENLRDLSRLSRFWQNPRVEQALIFHEIDSALAQATMLGKTAIIEQTDSERLVAALQVVRQEAAQGIFCISPSDGDIQNIIERRVSEQVGDLTNALRIARSKSDQVATNIRLWLRSATWEIFLMLLAVRQELVNVAQRDLDIIMPGYAYMQPDTPVVLAQWWLATEERLRHDFDRLCDFYRRLNMLPMGAGSVTYKGKHVDRDFIAEYLGFDGLIENSLSAVSDRDYLVEFGAFASLVGTHISQISSELLLWSTHEFGFITLRTPLKLDADTVPAVRNQSLLEILRSRPSAIFGRLSEFLAELKALPLGYCQDLQECMPGLIDIVDNLRAVLEIARIIIPAVQVDAKRMKAIASIDSANFDNAVNYLIERGLTQAKARSVVDELMNYCTQRSKSLLDLELNEWQQFSAAFDKQIYKYVTVEESRSSRTNTDLTSTLKITDALAKASDMLNKDRNRLPIQVMQRLKAIELESV